MSDLIFGFHPVLEALRARSRVVSRVVISETRHDRRVSEVIDAARAEQVTVQRMPQRALDRLAAGATHQGIVAVVTAVPYGTPEEILERATSPALIVVLDGVEDPRNLGAVIRAAAAAGAHGLFLPKRGAAGLSPTAMKASAGAAERFPVARVTNIVSLLKLLKDKGIWIVGLDPEGAHPWTGFDMTAPLAIVLGGEGKGLRRLARETCDSVLSIPLKRGIQSLNLAVAAGVVLFEAVRQRRLASADGGAEAPSK